MYSDDYAILASMKYDRLMILYFVSDLTFFLVIYRHSLYIPVLSWRSIDLNYFEVQGTIFDDGTVEIHDS